MAVDYQTNPDDSGWVRLYTATVHTYHRHLLLLVSAKDDSEARWWCRCCVMQSCAAVVGWHDRSQFVCRREQSETEATRRTSENEVFSSDFLLWFFLSLSTVANAANWKLTQVSCIQNVLVLGSVATRLRCGGIFYNRIARSLLISPQVKELW